MTFLMPAFVPAHRGPTFCSPRPSRPVARPSFAPFLSLVDDALNELQREAQRQARRKPTFNARFDVRETAQGYEVDAEVPGFEQENINIEMTDEQTLRVSGNTASRSEAQQPHPTSPQPEQASVEDKMEELEEETSKATSEGSETSSVKSYQATVEDDFEDLGAETSSTTSATSEPKGKEKAVEPTTPAPAAQTAVTQQQQPGSDQPRRWVSERSHGSFERTFKFPSRIDTTNVRASLKNGVLSISVPKAPVPEVQQILIQ